jgi:hypothetical protein
MPKSETGVPILIRFPSTLATRLRELAERELTSMTAIVVNATATYLERADESQERSAYEAALEQFITTLGNSPRDDRWDALIDVLRCFELKHTPANYLDIRLAQSEGESIGVPFRELLKAKRSVLVNDPKHETAGKKVRADKKTSRKR